ncbi:NADH-quinone oxidoreductase subunit G [Rhodococcus sp. D2-41]|uniref:NADH-quinone oxidoreductase subunit G n=1 Tax=Speluncibacter jeojiensis TaxID=2710754 RepID=UPI0024100B2F|nr:NADH-quinone oxidoreductase subunit G [Rhodococcus sp. D2-41]MDG3010721.1 NADH-quinone oxidoreductase subunit G [Rhodococcus sp. D2-41]
MGAVTGGEPGGGPDSRGTDTVHVTIDGVELDVPKGTLIIRAAEMIGRAIPRFCDHPLLDPAGACRQCLVEVDGQRKPVASCTMAVADDMVVHTQASSPVAEKAQRGVMEFLLINHPLDCPMCDKGGECPLQNQAMSNGQGETRFTDVKRTYPKPINISAEVLLDRERCILCARCTRFSQQIAGDPFIDMLERGALQQVGIYASEPFESYFSGNTVQICPVGALTGATYRFRARPFDLVSSPSVCEHCASGCAQRTDHRRGAVLRRLAGEDADVNEEWNCDKGRWAFTYATAPDRITAPMVRRDGTLVAVSWSEALSEAAQGLAAAAAPAVLTGGRLTVEDAYAYAKFARIGLHTNDIDFRARAHSAEEAQFLADRVAGRGVTASYRDLECAPVVLLVGFEPEEESPIVFLRLRKGVRSRGVRVRTIAPFASRGSVRLDAEVVVTEPGGEPDALDALADSEELRRPGAVILVGERLAAVPGGMSAAARLADATGARVAWIPRRAGERGALEAGALPNLLPGGHPVDDEQARRHVAGVWGADVPTTPGRDTAAILRASRDGAVDALVVAGLDPDDLPDPAAALAALDAAPFVVSLELRHSAVTDRADVVFPVAPVVEKSGSFLDWEGRARVFGAALADTGALPDHRVLAALAGAMRVPFSPADPVGLRAQLRTLGAWMGERAAPAPVSPPAPRPAPGFGEARLAAWRMLLDEGSLQDGEPHLAGTARRPVVRLSAATAAEIRAAEGDPVTVRTGRGAVTLPLAVTDMPERVVWLPMNSRGSAVHRQLGVTAGAVVRLSSGAGVDES